MTKQEILKEIEKSLGYCNDDSDYIIEFSTERLNSKSISKKKFVITAEKSIEPKQLKLPVSITMEELNKVLEKCAEEKAKQLENQLPFYHPYHWPYFIPNNPLQTPWYWDKVICSEKGENRINYGENESDEKIFGSVKGFTYP